MSNLINKEINESLAYPLWKLILFHFLTWGLYDVYWCYKAWKYLKIKENLYINPLYRALGLHLPIINIVLTYKLFKAIFEDLGEKKNSIFFLLLSLINTMIMVSVNIASHVFSLIYVNILNMLVFALVQTEINQKSETLIQNKFSRNETIFLFIILVFHIILFLCRRKLYNFTTI